MSDIAPAQAYGIINYINVFEQFLKAGKITEALVAATRGIKVFPNETKLQICAARGYMAAREYGQALNFLHKVGIFDPKNVELFLLVAECYAVLDDVPKAELYYKRVLKLEPDNITALSAVEPIIREQGRYAEVRDMLNHIETAYPAIVDSTITSRACLDLLDGDLETGFAGYEHRFAGFTVLRNAYGTPILPRWTGESLDGKSIIIRKEQGLGDSIQFVRYAATLKELGAIRVGVECKPTLVRLFSHYSIVDEVVTEITPAMDYDFEVMLMSTPHLCKTPLKTIPQAPYLTVAEADAQAWATRLAPFTKRRVGLVWAGDPKKGKWYTERMNERRSIPLEMFLPLLEADCDFFSLQFGERRADLKQFDTKIHDFMGEVKDYYDTACIVKNLSIVIAVDTSCAHLVGALGKPIWMLNRLEGDWRWMTERYDSPWYPTMTIYRQNEFRNWKPAIEEVKQYLLALG